MKSYIFSGKCRLDGLFKNNVISIYYTHFIHKKMSRQKIARHFCTFLLYF